MQVEIFDCLEDVRDEWLDFESAADSYPFQSYQWVDSWYRAGGGDAIKEICIVLVSDSLGDPLLLLPLGIKRHMGVNSLEWLGGPLSDYQAPILCPAFAQKVSDDIFGRLWETICKRLPEFDILRIERIPQWIGGQANPFFDLSTRVHPSSAHWVYLEGNFNDFHAAKRSSKTRSTERRKENRLGKLGDLRFIIPETSNEIGEVTSVMLRQKSENYKELGVVDLFADEANRKFIKVMSDQHIESGLVHLCALKLDERTLATHWGLNYKGRLYYLLPSYERDELTRYSPGNILLRNLLQWCFANNVHVFDFTVGNEPYKLQWRDEELKLADCILARTSKGKLAELLLASTGRLKLTIKNSPRLLRFAYAIRSAWGQLFR